MGELLDCHECSSFWISLAVVWSIQPLDTWLWNGILVFALLTPAQLLHGVRNYLDTATYRMLEEELGNEQTDACREP